MSENKLIDCFPFFNEKELLEFRIKLLYDKVDKFVITEANETHSGLKKKYNAIDVIQKIETDIKNSQDESWKSDRLQRLKKELKEIENGERDSLTFKPYHLNFLILKDLDYSAFDKVSKQKAHKMKIGKYFMEFTGGNSSGGTHYYFITKENDTIAEFRIREWIT